MKTKIYSALLIALFSLTAFAQDVTTVNAANSDISDNLDLRAVASIFGESSNLEDFERRLNDPKTQISNLDLNNDNQVDYLRVIESVEGNTHLVILQSVLSKDIFQDIATIEVERDNNDNVQIQVVGDTYMYGQNYIYEPVYVSRPVIYNNWWVGNYNPYVSAYYWNYYPTYYTYWHPHPIHQYRRNVNVYINTQNNYNYVNTRKSQRAVALYSVRRSNGYEKQYPTRSFQQRNAQVVNRYELDKRRTASNSGIRNAASTRTNSARSSKAANSRSGNIVKTGSGAIRKPSNSVRTNIPKSSAVTPRATSPTRSTSISPQNNINTRSNIRTNSGSITPKSSVSTTRQNPPVRAQAPIRTQTPPRQSAPMQSARSQNVARSQQAAPARAQSASSAPAQRAAPNQAASQGRR